MNQFAAFKQMGVSKTMPISTGMQLVGTSLFGVLAFGEWSNRTALLLGISALVLIVAGAAFTSYKEDKSKQDENIGKGLLLLLISTVGYVGYVVIARWFNINGWEAVLPQAVGMVISAVLLSLRKGNLFTKKTAGNTIGGLMWAVGNIALLFATAKVGVATSFFIVTNRCRHLDDRWRPTLKRNKNKKRNDVRHHWLYLGCRWRDHDRIYETIRRKSSYV